MTVVKRYVSLTIELPDLWKDAPLDTINQELQRLLDGFEINHIIDYDFGAVNDIKFNEVTVTDEVTVELEASPRHELKVVFDINDYAKAQGWARATDKLKLLKEILS